MQFAFMVEGIGPAGSTPLHAWHIQPIGLYRKQAELTKEASVFATDHTSNVGFNLLHDDPEALLVIHFHGAGGNVGSGFRIPNYRALSAGDPDRIHILTFDYRGFGNSPGSPSEYGLIQDAIAVVEWAINVARIPPSRILIIVQFLGTAVNTAVAEHYASKEDPIIFSGHIVIAPFEDVLTLVTPYKIAGTVPVLSPVAQYPILFDFLSSHIREHWSTKTRIASYVRCNEANSHKYGITLIHAEDDYDIPFDHTPALLWQAINATSPTGVTQDEVQTWKLTEGQAIGAAGHVAHWRTQHGTITEYLLKHGLHDVVMGAPIVTLAAMNIFEASRGSSKVLVEE